MLKSEGAPSLERGRCDRAALRQVSASQGDDIMIKRREEKKESALVFRARVSGQDAASRKVR